ncbi:lipoprotein-releasing ABC transporter ATP-binding protein LolD [Pseudohongiella sp. SYSU M77423]|uniref:lipoprotein-releasing ABC transporter ATP-binding protein LolD n=1 Tax=Pseudohongiella sp. SYSU M77423 TaxID=3042312 RepID=UPI000C92051C|nr:lipoprotein-releasing ABC transporter ATP-binding protein LolD [Pseudohongiella sp. SYSU M77423]MAY56172.1 lipoprotein-releasing system ATP-binding protein LolD [Gammaproteobacteria bacterium]MDH7945002.1 lipoprotein-releasing ABC transporter ATP-binding protein LolD [Pseudohongiella sp. SYSU M77423]MEC8858455.1 lipoprotein-releasing ABC transporter ATP-binding protein LolD [Pseudomonadota bacterium]HBN14611.1 lipoprotein-releasing ABC transporter ATP-binding protein LolD [Pseudohongiella sp|tara:strand:+ start:332 stop:1039 length:708 start_codon:yes stop_codon:yes gene_type:complete
MERVVLEQTANVISCRHLRKSYTQGPQQVDVLLDINLNVRPAECVAIVGSSGSGKTTLLNLLGGLDAPSGGEIYVAGQDLSRLSESERGQLRNRYLGFVYQFHHLLGEFSALENVAMPLLIGGQSSREAYPRASELLGEVGLSHRLNHKPSELSGGERQRVAIARALVASPRCVLMDEPTGNLDRRTAEGIHTLMQTLNKSLQTSFVVVTHDERFAASLDRVLVLNQGTLEAEHA